MTITELLHTGKLRRQLLKYISAEHKNNYTNFIKTKTCYEILDMKGKEYV